MTANGALGRRYRIRLMKVYPPSFEKSPAVPTGAAGDLFAERALQTRLAIVNEGAGLPPMVRP